MCALRQVASWLSVIRVNCVPMTSTSPSVGRSIPASKFSKVDFPEPLGPINARKSPSCNSRSTWSKATISNPSRVKRFVTLRTRTIGSDIVFILKLLNFDTTAVAQFFDSRHCDRLVATQAIKHYVSITSLFSGAYGTLLDLITLNDEHECAVVFLNHRRFRHQHARDCLAVTARSFVGKEIDSGIHLRPQLLVRILALALHLDRRLGAIGLGRDLRDVARELEIRIRLGNDLGPLRGLQPREVSLADVQLDLQIGEIREIDN